ncbi:hypothetical protein R6Q57_004186 [Mikania cordata]
MKDKRCMWEGSVRAKKSKDDTYRNDGEKPKFSMATSKLQALWNHPAGPKTIHFWAPTFKWGISIANIADFAKPPEKLSYPQQFAVTATGIIWSRYSMVITPKNWNLFSVNVAMAGTGLYQLSRKIRHDYFNEEEAAALKE